MKKKLSVALVLQLCTLQTVCFLGTAMAEELKSKEAKTPQVNKQPTPWGPVSATFGPGGLGFPVGKFAAVINYRFLEADGLHHNGDQVSDMLDVTKNVGVVKFRYGIAPGLDIRTATPIYNVEVDNSVNGTSRTRDGVGDTTVLLHKVVMNQRKGAAFSTAFDLGMTFPTATVDSDSIDFIGNQAWGAFAGVAFTYFKSAYRLDQEFNYAAFTEGEHDYQKPVRFRANTTFAYALSPLFDIGVESSFEWNDESQSDDAENGDSFSEWYAGPKVAYKLQKHGFYAGLGVTFPLKCDYDGYSTSDEFRVELKLVKVF